MANTLKESGEKRAEPRRVLTQYRSVEIDSRKDLPLFQFQLRDISPSGVGILVKADSKFLGHIKVGQVVNMQYNPKNPHDSPRQMTTEIRHITNLDEGPFRGHFLVGFAILKEE
jgi:hypothetical protein